jgi:membrane protein implicated in regulation of membrane protease activity
MGREEARFLALGLSLLVADFVVPGLFSCSDMIPGGAALLWILITVLIAILGWRYTTRWGHSRKEESSPCR